MNRSQIKKQMIKKVFNIASSLGVFENNNVVIRCDEDSEFQIEIVVPLNMTAIVMGDVRAIDNQLIGTDYHYYIQVNGGTTELELSVLYFFEEKKS